MNIEHRNVVLFTISFIALWAASVPAQPQNMIEVVQSVQSLDDDVRLIAGKPTIVRAYVDGAENAGLTVIGQLETTRVGSGRSVMIDSLNSLALVRRQTNSLITQHDDIGQTLNFSLPNEWTASGRVSFRLARLLRASDRVELPCSACSSTNPKFVSFLGAPPLKLKVVYFAYNVDGVSPFAYPSDADLVSIQSWLMRTYPTAQLTLSSSVVDARANQLSGHFSCTDLNDALGAIRLIEVTKGGVDPLTHYYGLVSDKYFLMPGCSIVPDLPDPRVVASGPAGNPAHHPDIPSIFWDKSPLYTGWYAAHELAHTFGRSHPGKCGESSDDSDFPYDRGFLSNSPEKYVGLDLGNKQDFTSVVALPGLKWTDMMTYCANKWISFYTYDAILKRLYAENGLDPNGGPGTLSPLQLQANAGAQSSAGFIDILASVNFTTSHATFKYVQKSDLPYFKLAGQEGEAILNALDRDGRTVETVHVQLYRSTDISPDVARTAAVRTSIPYDDRIASLELVVSETIRGTYLAGSTRAAVNDLLVKNATDLNKEEFSIMTSATQAEGPENGILVRWKAVGEGVTYTVEISADQGHTWNTAAVGLTEHYFAIVPKKMQVSEGSSVLLRVTAHDGFRSTAVKTQSLVIGKRH